MKKMLILVLILFVISTAIMPSAIAKSTVEASSFRDRVREFFQNIRFINNTINFIKNIFGLVEDGSENSEDNLDSSEQSTYFNPYLYVNEDDPKSAKPTDTSISVNIKDFDITYTTDDETFEFDIFFNGKTSGDVYACYWVMVAYFDDGTNSYQNVWNGPRNQQDLKLYDNVFDLTFYGAGPGGFSDWSTFEGRQFITGDIGDNEDVVFEYPENDDYEKLPTDYILYVRAFSDKDLTKWNQDSISLFDDLPDQIVGDSKEGNNTPGFEIISFIVAIGISIIVIKKKSLIN